MEERRGGKKKKNVKLHDARVPNLTKELGRAPRAAATAIAHTHTHTHQSVRFKLAFAAAAIWNRPAQHHLLPQ